MSLNEFFVSPKVIHYRMEYIYDGLTLIWNSMAFKVYL